MAPQFGGVHCLRTFPCFRLSGIIPLCLCSASARYGSQGDHSRHDGDATRGDSGRVPMSVVSCASV